MSFTRSFIGTMVPSLLSAVLFTFALEGLATFSQCLLVSIGLFMLINCAVTLSTQSRGIVFMTDMSAVMKDLEDLLKGDDDEKS